MLKTTGLFIIMLLTLHTLGQRRNLPKDKKSDITNRIEEINALLKYYDGLSPFSDDNNRFEVIDSVRQGIVQRLLNLLNDKRIIQYPIESLLYQDELSISKSSDNNLFFFSLDEKTGGSYKPNISIIHYRLPNGRVKAEAFGEMMYEPVFLLDSVKQIYFVIGSVQTCNTCSASKAMTIQLDTMSYQTNIIAQYDGRQYDVKTFEYDSTNKVFYYEYNAADPDDSLYGEHADNSKEHLQHVFKGKFKFEDGIFMEMERCEFWEKRE